MSDSVINDKTKAKAGSSNLLEPEGIQTTLECPVCFELLDVPILLCGTGHMICGGCRNKLSQCPLCEGQFTNTRNFLAEALLSKLYRYCSNKNGGCDFKTMGEEALVLHEKACEFRPFTCNLSGPRHICKMTKVRVDNMAVHLKDGHRLQGFEEASAAGSWQATKESLQKILNGDNPQRYDCFYLECHDKMFLVCQLLVRSKVFLYAVIVGNAKDAKRFHVIIKMENSQTGIETMWKGPVHSLRRPPQQLLTDGKGLYLTPEAFFTLTTPMVQQDSSFVLNPNLREISWKVTYEIEEIDTVDKIYSFSAHHVF